MKKNWLSIVLIVAAVVLAVFSWRCLPDVVTVQVGLDGRATNTLPKMAAIVIPLGLSLVGSLMSLTAKRERTTGALFWRWRVWPSWR